MSLWKWEKVYEVSWSVMKSWNFTTTGSTNPDFKRGVDYIGVSVAFVCHDGEGKVLLNKRSVNCRDEQGRWDNGGGSMEFGETFEQCLVRELKEEYCVEPEAFEHIGTFNNLREHDGKTTHWICVVYAVKVDPSKVQNGEPHKIDEFGWFSPEALPSPQHSCLQRAMQMLKEAKIFSRK